MNDTRTPEVQIRELSRDGFVTARTTFLLSILFFLIGWTTASMIFGVVALISSTASVVAEWYVQMNFSDEKS